jgi:C4-dicarboxylate-specific signal transduction histidine kinase
VSGDPIQFSQIILNLYRNAMDALIESTQPEIQIYFEERNGRVLLTVRDNGSGLTADSLAHAGEAFFTTKDNGLGMGLSISRHIAEQHGGTLILTNAEAGGALAILDLPSKSIS